VKGKRAGHRGKDGRPASEAALGSAANVRGYIDVRDRGNGQQNKTNIEFHLLP
jgi:hypothetical protein